jgi:ubiquinol-cytochrome c reductase cytochrome b subunit
MAVSLSRHTGIVALLYWIWDGVDRTIFTAI